MIKELQGASHFVVMITGDNALTACHVAKELRIVSKPILNLTFQNDVWMWQSVDQSQQLPLDHDYKTLVKSHDLSLTGDALQYLRNHSNTFLNLILPHVKV